MHLVFVTPKKYKELHYSIIAESERLTAHFMRMDGEYDIFKAAERKEDKTLFIIQCDHKEQAEYAKFCISRKAKQVLPLEEGRIDIKIVDTDNDKVF